MTSPSTDHAVQTGMGVVVGATGVTFRVWAPHASQVFVTGSFNNWSEDASPLHQVENGCWSAVVPSAKTGDEYRYLLHGPGGVQSRIDPRARQVTNSAGNGVIYDPGWFDWGNDGFQTASGNELVIYELHVGTFNVTQAGQPGTFDSAIEKLPFLCFARYQRHRVDASG